ncbi:MAG: sigma factor-like helix-turn-helix DNA-binding protein [Chloroflexota bacterium]
MPLSDVAEALGVPEGKVRSRLHHAMRGLPFRTELAAPGPYCDF